MHAPPLLITLAVLALSGLQSRANILVNSGETIAFLGDSITQFGGIEDGGYVKLVQAGLADQGVNVSVINAGLSGNTSRNMLDRLERDVISRNPT